MGVGQIILAAEALIIGVSFVILCWKVRPADVVHLAQVLKGGGKGNVQRRGKRKRRR